MDKIQMSYSTYDKLCEKYENKTLNTIGYSFTERDLQIIKDSECPEEFIPYLIFLQNKLTRKEDITRLNKYLRETLELIDDEEGEYEEK